MAFIGFCLWTPSLTFANTPSGRQGEQGITGDVGARGERGFSGETGTFLKLNCKFCVRYARYLYSNMDFVRE